MSAPLDRDPAGARSAALSAHAAGRLHTAAERFAAASLLVDSDVVEEVEAAHSLALAVMATEPRARPVAAMAYDRLRRLAGKPQKFGTQVVDDGVGGRRLWPVDPATTDSERAKWDVPPLAELRRRCAP